MSYSNSDHIRDCLTHTNGNTVDNSSRGESRNQRSPTDPAGKGATSQNPPSYSASENSRASNRPSEPTSDAFSSGTRPKRVIDLGPTYPIKKLKTMEDFSTELNQPISMKGHTMLIDIPYFQRGVIVPYQGNHIWDANHVKLPHLYKSRASPSRWDATRQALNRLTKESFSIGDIENVHAMDNNLHMVIPKMAKLAPDLPDLIQQPIPLLRQQQNQAITMSQQQISCLLANAAFCTFPHRNNTSPGSEYTNYPTINFSRMCLSSKALIQLMAAAVADRDMAFFTFGGEHLAYEVQRMHDILAKNRVIVDKLYKILKDYCEHACEHRSPKDLYRFIREKIGHTESSL
ncbi:Poly(ADP-ribose) glycohydrolase [Anabarilius grahami]|uniref:Poly(ADP-ribose) glycohydrolase n=1 Tax=Anabarilius grahami TaxID=495550 RepID=A0A3N0Z702_ANAGA|nr:Poly(ADP-ribose) glycohydrolase [Anabarilius grahami]